MSMTQNKFFRSLIKVTILLSVIAVVSFATYQSLSSAKAVGAGKAMPTADAPQPRKVIARMWHGRVLTTKADEYYPYLKAGIDKIKTIEGNLGAQVMRRNNGKETEFVVISYWESTDAIRKFAGEDIEKTHFLPKDPQYLLELEPKVKHFEVVLDERK
jgi:heme-degrading monooxygenase HmoA